MTHDKEFWQQRYSQNQIGWDIGEISTPIKKYVDQLNDKNISILIPGCGNAHEAEYLLQKGFSNIILIDIAENLVNDLKKKFAAFIIDGKLKIFCSDFFSTASSYDLIIEQTFFCAINPSLRKKYAEKIVQLLKPNGKLVGVLFNTNFDDGPPFGGNKKEYMNYFSELFQIKTFEICYNSIKPREGKELFIIFGKL